MIFKMCQSLRVNYTITLPYDLFRPPSSHHPHCFGPLRAASSSASFRFPSINTSPTRPSSSRNNSPSCSDLEFVLSPPNTHSRPRPFFLLPGPALQFSRVEDSTLNKYDTNTTHPAPPPAPLPNFNGPFDKSLSSRIHTSNKNCFIPSVAWLPRFMIIEEIGFVMA
mgnify:CR=1 FL=1